METSPGAVWAEAREAWETLSARHLRLVYTAALCAGLCLLTLVLLLLGLWWPAGDEPDFWLLRLARSPIPATVFVVGLVAGLQARAEMGDIGAAQKHLEMLVRENERQDGGLW